MTVGPPEPRPVVIIPRKDLLRQRLSLQGLHGEVMVEDVLNLGSVFQEEAMADAAITHAVSNDQPVSSVDRDPPVRAVPDRSADDRRASHRVADSVKMEAVLAQLPFLA